MSGVHGLSWPEQLAGLLEQARERCRSEELSLRQHLERRRTELSVGAGKTPDAGELQLQAGDLELTAEARRRELAALERTGEELARQEGELESALQETSLRLQARCAELVARLPLLDGTGAAGWLAWIEEWHQRLGRPFEPAADWREHFASRRALVDALARVAPLVQHIHDLEVAPDGPGTARSLLPAEISREEEGLRELEETIAARLQQVGTRYGHLRIVEDLPDAAPRESPARLAQIESLLLYLERTLGRFAESARLERQMLEALQ